MKIRTILPLVICSAALLAFGATNGVTLRPGANITIGANGTGDFTINSSGGGTGQVNDVAVAAGPNITVATNTGSGKTTYTVSAAPGASVSMGGGVTVVTNSVGGRTDYKVTATGGVRLPFVMCYSNGTYFVDGVPYSPANSTTCGIQEALNTAYSNNASGCELYLGPGVFYTYDTIQTPWNGRLPNTFKIHGAGRLTSGITYVGKSNKNVLVVGYPGGKNETIFEMNDMWLASANQSTNFLLWLNGAATNGSPPTMGGLTSATIMDNYFTYWTFATNNGGLGFVPTTFGDAGAKHNLVPINVDCNYNGDIWILRNHFNFVNGLSISTDGVMLQDNAIQSVGNFPSTRNDWPASSIYSAGAAIYLTETQNGLVRNGNEGWRFFGNAFVATGPCYFFNNVSSDQVSYNDNMEGCAAFTVASKSPSGNYRRWTAVNPMCTNPNLDVFATNNFVMTNTASGYAGVTWYGQPNNSRVSVYDLRNNKVAATNVTYTGTVTASKFITTSVSPSFEIYGTSNSVKLLSLSNTNLDFGGIPALNLVGVGAGSFKTTWPSPDSSGTNFSADLGPNGGVTKIVSLTNDMNISALFTPGGYGFAKYVLDPNGATRRFTIFTNNVFVNEGCTDRLSISGVFWTGMMTNGFKYMASLETNQLGAFVSFTQFTSK